MYPLRLSDIVEIGHEPTAVSAGRRQQKRAAPAIPSRTRRHRSPSPTPWIIDGAGSNNDVTTIAPLSAQIGANLQAALAHHFLLAPLKRKKKSYAPAASQQSQMTK